MNRGKPHPEQAKTKSRSSEKTSKGGPPDAFGYRAQPVQQWPGTVKWSGSTESGLPATCTFYGIFVFIIHSQLMFLSLYRFFSALFLPLFLACFSQKGREVTQLKGNVPKVTEENLPVIWVQCLSVGEVAAIRPVIEALLKELPKAVIYLSVSTRAGYDAVQGKLPYHYLSYIPYDNEGYLLKALKHICPSLVIITETGFWPVMLTLLHKRDTPTFLLHGRISDRSLKRYLLLEKYTRFCSALFKNFSLIFPKSLPQRERFALLGAAEEKLCFEGDTKIDSFRAAPEEKIKEMCLLLTRKEEEIFTIVAGSTHEGEEELIVHAWREVQKRSQKPIRLILAPRRPERVKEVAQLLRRENTPFLLRTSLTGKEDTPLTEVILLDTIGELQATYSLADVVIIGRSFIPPGGGHSVLEPAFAGKFSLFGAYISYNQEDADALCALQAARQLQSPSELPDALFEALHSPPKGYNEKLEAFFHEQSGASVRVVRKMLPFLHHL